MAESKFTKMIYEWRVRVCSIALILVIILSRPTLASLLAGVGICLIGLFIRIWAAGHLRKEKKLTISGPYQYTRNPLYLGNFILGIGVVVGSYSWFVLGIFIFYFLLFYPPVIRKESERMKELFAEKYEEYKKKVPLFLPSLKPYPCPEKIKFSWALYNKNKEYRALIGTAVFWIILVAKLLFWA